MHTGLSFTNDSRRFVSKINEYLSNVNILVPAIGKRATNDSFSSKAVKNKPFFYCSRTLATYSKNNTKNGNLKEEFIRNF